ncbi:MAG: hypothetical protein ABJE95_23135 [Byssovorax sp.]
MAGCGGTDTTSSGTTGGGGAPDDLAHPPAPKDGSAAPDGSGDTVLAIKKLYLGDTNRDGTANKVNGWKQYGYDIDGFASTATSTNLCKPRNNNAAKNVYPDGDKGIDNSFGKNILTIILGIASDASAKVNAGIGQGKFTIMLSMGKLGAGSDYKGLTTKLYGGADLMANPKFDGTDKWPVIPELLNDPADITSAKVQFPGAYLVNNTWVSGGKGEVLLNLSVSGFTLSLPIGSAVITMELSADHKSATKGTIAGVLPTDTLTSELKKIAGAFDPSLCKGPTIDSIVSQIEQASDIGHDGTQDASKECDGISIGLGFDAGIVQLGAIAPVSPPKENPCDAMGTGTGSSSGTGG